MSILKRGLRTKSSTFIVKQNSFMVGMKRPYISLKTPSLEPIIDDDDGDKTEEKDEMERKFSPDVDPEMTNVVTFGAVRDVSRKELPIIELPPIPGIKDISYEMIMSAKLELCSEILDFSNKEIQVQQKEEKRKTLNELIQYFEHCGESKRINSIYQRAVFRMLDKNIFRNDPKFPSALETYNYTLNVVEPSWPHLLYCYQLLNRFIHVFPEAEFVNFSVMKKALFLTQLPDSNERFQLVRFLKSYYDLHPKEQPKILKELKFYLIMLRNGVLNPYSLMPLLMFLSHILTKNSNNITEECMSAFKEGALPLIGFTYLIGQYQHLKNFFINAMRIDPLFGFLALQELQRMWPRQSGTKKQLMIDFMINIAQGFQHNTFEQIAHTFFKFLANNLLTYHHKIILSVLSIWTNPEYKKFVTENSAIAVNKMYEAVQDLAKNHWDNLIRGKCELVLKEMSETNTVEFHKRRMAQKKKDTLGIKFESVESLRRCIETWMFVTQKACDNGDTTNFDKKVQEIKAYFKRTKSDHESRILPKKFRAEYILPEQNKLVKKSNTTIVRKGYSSSFTPTKTPISKPFVSKIILS